VPREQLERNERWARWFGRHATRRLRRSFDRWEVHGLHLLEAAARRGPIVVVANHTSFWDAMVLGYLGTRLEVPCYGLVDEHNLGERPFLRKAGALAIDVGNPRHAARELREVARMLATTKSALFVFPQGGERPPHEPLEFEGGAALVARMAKASVVPMALRYIMGSSDRPHLWLSVGEPLALEASRDPKAQADAVRRELERIDAGLTRRADLRMPGRTAKPPDGASEFETAYIRPLPWWRRVGEWFMTRRVEGLQASLSASPPTSSL
jgi:1-acyl-sn-glycerol-3-phosphate acyltransferase